MMQIYLIFNKINEKIYIGKTTELLKRRWQRHLVKASGNSQQAIHRAIRKYGAENFDIHLIGAAKTKETLNNLEKVYIILFNSRNKQFGYNRTSGGDGVEMTPEIRAKISEATVRRFSKPEERAKVSGINHYNYGKPSPLLGRKMSPEVCEKMSRIRKGRKFSKEWIEKLSQANRGENNFWYGKYLSEEHKAKIRATKERKRRGEQ